MIWKFYVRKFAKKSWKHDWRRTLVTTILIKKSNITHIKINMKKARICHIFGLLLLTSLLCCNKCTASQGKRHFFSKHFFLSFKKKWNKRQWNYILVEGMHTLLQTTFFNDRTNVSRKVFIKQMKGLNNWKKKCDRHLNFSDWRCFRGN